MTNYKLLILSISFLTCHSFLIKAEGSYYLTQEEKTQQGWPIDVDVPRELPENIAQGVKEEIDKKITHQVNMIMEWAGSQTPEELLSKLDTSKLLNSPTDGDTIENRAKKLAKQKISQKLNVQPISSNNSPANQSISYWQQYAPQMLQDAGDYAASWVPESVRDRINSWSTKKKLAIASAILASLAAVYNREIIIEFIKNAIKEPIKLEKKLIPLLSEKDIADVYDKTEQKCENMKYSNTQDYYIFQYRRALNQSHTTHSYLNSIGVQKYILEAYLALKKLDNEWLIKHYPEYR